jgi:hypothetical protein
MKEGVSGIKLIQPKLDDHHMGCRNIENDICAFSKDIVIARGGMMTGLEQFGE